MTVCVELVLPQGFDADGILAFHRRDPQAVAERIDGHTLVKGLVWRGRPACLTLALQAGRAVARLDVDAAADEANETQAADAAFWSRRVARMLGLDQGIEAFEARHAAHPLLGPVLARQRGLRVPVAASPFEALSWAVAGQQVSVAAAVSLRRRLIQAVGWRQAGGLLCYPEAGQVAALSVGELRAAGFSVAKAVALRDLAHRVVGGELPLDDWAESSPLPIEDLRARLLAVRGVGPWTVHYTLLRGYGWLDGSLHGDVAVRRGLQALLGREDKLSEKETEQWLAGFAPWRALVGAHLWAMQSQASY